MCVPCWHRPQHLPLWSARLGQGRWVHSAHAALSLGYAWSWAASLLRPDLSSQDSQSALQSCFPPLRWWLDLAGRPDQQGLVPHPRRPSATRCPGRPSCPRLLGRAGQQRALCSAGSWAPRGQGRPGSGAIPPRPAPWTKDLRVRVGSFFGDPPVQATQAPPAFILTPPPWPALQWGA